jgi:hypothetical protein
MTLTARIDYDVKCLENYFQRLFDVLGETILEKVSTPMKGQDIDATESWATYHRFDQHIKPDMLINIYNLVEFWMREICKYHKLKSNLKLEYKDIKGDNDLHAYKKYLADYAGLDLTSAEDSYKRLDELRRIRNVLIHSGGHVLGDETKNFSKIKGITLTGSLLVVDDKYIWSTLAHAKNYLFITAQA